MGEGVMATRLTVTAITSMDLRCIVNMLEIPGEFQVMIHVTIAQINRYNDAAVGC